MTLKQRKVASGQVKKEVLWFRKNKLSIQNHSRLSTKLRCAKIGKIQASVSSKTLAPSPMALKS